MARKKATKTAKKALKTSTMKKTKGGLFGLYPSRHLKAPKSKVISLRDA